MKNAVGMAYIMVSPKVQNISQMIFFSTSYVVLNGDIVTLLNPHLKLHTGWKKKSNSFKTQKSFSIDMVKEQEISKDNAKVKTKWNAILRTSSLDPLWRTRAIDLELNPTRSSLGMAQGCWTSEALWGLRNYGAKAHERGSVTQHMGSSCMQAAREFSEDYLGFHVKIHFNLEFTLESSSTLNDPGTQKCLFSFAARNLA